MRQRAIAVIVLMVAATTIALEAAKIKIQKDPKTDFTTLSTWNWNPDGPGVVKVWLSADSKSEPVQRKYEPVLMQSVEEQFAARGYTRASTAPPDFIVTYYVLVAMGSSSQYAGQFLPANANFGIPMFAPATTALSLYPQGTLIIDAKQLSTGRYAWRGMAEAKVEYENTDEKRATNLKAVIKDLLGKFPQKKKKS